MHGAAISRLELFTNSQHLRGSGKSGISPRLRRSRGWKRKGGNERGRSEGECNCNGELITRNIIAFPGSKRGADSSVQLRRGEGGERVMLSEARHRVCFLPPRSRCFAHSATYLIYLESCCPREKGMYARIASEIHGNLFSIVALFATCVIIRSSCSSSASSNALIMRKRISRLENKS